MKEFLARIVTPDPLAVVAASVASILIGIIYWVSFIQVQIKAFGGKPL